MKKALDLIFKATEFLCKLALTVQVLVIFIVVVGRYVFNSTPAWGEALALFLTTWVGLLGAAVVLREDKHIRVTVMEYVLPKKVINILIVISDVGLIVFSGFMFYSGYLLTKQTVVSVFSGLGISRAWIYVSTVVFGALVFLAEIENTVKHIKAVNEVNT